MPAARKSEAKGRLPLRFEGGKCDDCFVGMLVYGRNTEYGLQLLLMGRGQVEKACSPFPE